MTTPLFLFIGGDADGERLPADGSSHWRVPERCPMSEYPSPSDPIPEFVQTLLYTKQPFCDAEGAREYVYVHNEARPLLRLIEEYRPAKPVRHTLPQTAHDTLLPAGLEANFRGQPLARMTREDLIVCLMMVAGGMR